MTNNVLVVNPGDLEQVRKDASDASLLGLKVVSDRFVEPGKAYHLRIDHSFGAFEMPNFVVHGTEQVSDRFFLRNAVSGTLMVDPRYLWNAPREKSLSKHLSTPRNKRNLACLTWQAANAKKRKGSGDRSTHRWPSGLIALA
jgi:predicted alpha/beta-hydrolase family hydrolase